MPEVIRFHLAGEPPQSPYQHATGLRAIVLDRIRTADPELSARIHDANQSKPFSISPLLQDVEQGRLWFDLSVLADEVGAPLREGIALSRDTIRLGPQRFDIQRIETVAQVSWYDLLTPPSPDLREFAFQILSPTAHHTPGAFRKSIVLPSPEFYFGSWRGRWNVCCREQKFDDTLIDVITAQVAVKDCQGGTHAVKLDQGRVFIGFQGTVRFVLLKPETVSFEARTALAALARFASFCGTGVDTMRGMGQTMYLF